MKLTIYSLLLGIMVTYSLLMLCSVSGVELVAIRLLAAPAYLLSVRPWLGLDCANADSIPDKLKCAGLMLAMDVWLYSALSFGAISLFRRLRKAAPGRRDATVDLS